MAQREQKPFGGAPGKPNILVIFGDDIGTPMSAPTATG